MLNARDLAYIGVCIAVRINLIMGSDISTGVVYSPKRSKVNVDVIPLPSVFSMLLYEYVIHSHAIASTKPIPDQSPEHDPNIIFTVWSVTRWTPVVKLWD
jgi:hypothetical protein